MAQPDYILLPFEQCAWRWAFGSDFENSRTSGWRLDATSLTLTYNRILKIGQVQVRGFDLLEMVTWPSPTLGKFPLFPKGRLPRCTRCTILHGRRPNALVVVERLPRIGAVLAADSERTRYLPAALRIVGR